MNSPYFKRIGIIFIPNNLFGWLILLTGVVYSVKRFIYIDSRSHSVSDTIRPFLINLFIIFTAYTLIAVIINTILKGKDNLPG